LDGKDVMELELLSETGVRLSLLNYAALVRDWQLPIAGKEKRSVVCGFNKLEHYIDHSPYFGAIVGRVANRIGGSKFELDGNVYNLPANEGKNHLHGGPKGLGKRVWDMEVISESEGPAVRFSICENDKEMGYPGNLFASVVYRLRGNRLGIEFEATTDAPTPINLIQHNYFNLMGDGSDISAHVLCVPAANKYLKVNSELIPSGEIMSAEGTELDFRKPKALTKDGGPLSIDNSLVFEPQRNKQEPAATMHSGDGLVTLKLWTDQPGLHVYTGGGMKIPVEGLAGVYYKRCGAVCLEDQNFPDAINHSNFPSPVIRAGETYRHKCEIEIFST